MTMKRSVAGLPALSIAVCLNFAIAAFAAGTNCPPASQNLPETGPLAALTIRLTHINTVFPLEHKLALALDLLSPEELNRVILGPEQEVDDASKSLNWMEGVRSKGRRHLIIGHSEWTGRGVVLVVYLTSSSGVLEKAVQRVNGGEFTDVPLQAAAAGFQKQTAFWLAQAAKADGH
jgi:hypothetical protein